MYSYNHSRHRGIGMKPADVNPEDESIVWQRLYGDEPRKANKYKFNVGDQVRISKARRTFKKGYLPSWTGEIFTFKKRVQRRLPVYKIADYHGEELEGTFYEQELQNIIKKDSDFYGIEKVIKSRMRGKRREYLAKCLGYSNDFNSWVPEDNVKDISK